MAFGNGIMVSAVTLVGCLLLFAALGTGWVIGCNYIKDRAPQMLVRFYLIYAVFRVLTVLSVAAVYIFFISDSIGESKSFVIMLFVMYALMMALTLKLKH